MDCYQAGLENIEGMTVRPMMSCKVVHYYGRVLGFIVEEGFLLEDGPTAGKLLPDCRRRPLFPGSKDFVLIPDTIGPKYLKQLADALYDDLPVPKPRKPKAKPKPKSKANVNAASKAGFKATKAGSADDPIQSFKKFYRNEKKK